MENMSFWALVLNHKNTQTYYKTKWLFCLANPIYYEAPTSCIYIFHFPPERPQAHSFYS